MSLYPRLFELCVTHIGSSSEPWGRCSAWFWSAAWVPLGI